MVKLLIFIEFSSVLNARLVDLFNVTLAVNLVASSVLYLHTYLLTYSTVPSPS